MTSYRVNLQGRKVGGERVVIVCVDRLFAEPLPRPSISNSALRLGDRFDSALENELINHGGVFLRDVCR